MNIRETIAKSMDEDGMWYFLFFFDADVGTLLYTVGFKSIPNVATYKKIFEEIVESEQSLITTEMLDNATIVHTINREETLRLIDLIMIDKEAATVH